MPLVVTPTPPGLSVPIPGNLYCEASLGFIVVPAWKTAGAPTVFVEDAPCGTSEASLGMP